MTKLKHEIKKQIWEEKIWIKTKPFLIMLWTEEKKMDHKIPKTYRELYVYAYLFLKNTSLDLWNFVMM